MLQPGDRISSWEILRPIGAGGMGSVFLCRDALGGQIQAAVKVNAMLSPEGRLRFMREVEALSAIEHPGIVALRSWGEDPERGLLWLAMDHLEGDNLEDHLERGAMPLGQVVPAFTLLARALQHAHASGIFHRDVKPANIVLTADGPRLVDFGIAFQQDRTRLTTENQVPGTIAYMPPELISATVAPDPHLSDIYALGTILCEALTGRAALDLPEGLSDRQRFAKVMASKLEAKAFDPGPGHPPHLRELVRRSTDPDPATRLDDWELFVDLLEGRGASKSVIPWVVALGVLTMVLVVGGGLFALRLLVQFDPSPGSPVVETPSLDPAEPVVVSPTVLAEAPGPEATEPSTERASEPAVPPPAPSVGDRPAPSTIVEEPTPEAVVELEGAPAAVALVPGELRITVNGTPRTLRVSELIYASREGGDTRVVTTTGSHLCEQTITDLARDITDPAVLRVHRDFLVNANHVSVLGEGVATTPAGEVTVSPRYLEPLRAAAGL